MSTLAAAEPGSLWQSELPDQPRRPPVRGEVRADVAVIGAGFTGLWTAYYLSTYAPATRILLIDTHYVGNGASGRSGGLRTTEMPALLALLLRV